MGYWLSSRSPSRERVFSWASTHFFDPASEYAPIGRTEEASGWTKGPARRSEFSGSTPPEKIADFYANSHGVRSIIYYGIWTVTLLTRDFSSMDWRLN